MIPLILLPGWRKTAKDYHELVGLLAEKSKVFALDLPGFGQVPLEKPYCLDDYVSYLAAFLNSRHWGKVILVGHSFGGRVAIKFALKYPETAVKLVLIASAGIERKPWWIRALGVVSSLAPNGWKRLAGPIFASKDYAETDGYLRETMKNVINENLEDQLDQLIPPTLIIWGSQDRTTPLEQGKLMAKLVSNAKLEVIAGGNHGIAYRRAREVAQKIIDFVL